VAVSAVITTENRPGATPECEVGDRVMAQVDTWEGGTNATYLDFIYNVTMAVGPPGRAPNRPDDVMLVQYLMKTIVRVGLWVPPTLSKPFPVDGRMGPDTAAWIQDYQLTKHRRIIQDGRIDRALGVNASIVHQVYTIIYLNDDFQFATVLRSGSLDWYNALEDDVEAPAELRRAIRSSRARGSTGLPWDSPGLVEGR
jgi:hypothetical protein